MLKSIVILIIVFLLVELRAQFSIENFIDEPIKSTFEQARGKLKDKNVEQSTILNFKSLVYTETFEKIQLRIGYLFDDGNQKGKIVQNKDENEKDAIELFNLLQIILTKKFTDNFSKTQIGGMTLLNWRGLQDLSITLSRKGSKTILTIVKK